MLCRLYLALAAIALVATWRQNLAFQSERGLSLPETFVQFWPALLANRATISITVDIFMFVLAAVIWMVLEARRLQIRYVWLYVVFAITIAISVTFPLFLYARERRLAVVEAGGTEPKPTAGDKAGLAFLTVGTIAFAAWCTLR
jgi:hypothetical protein